MEQHNTSSIKRYFFDCEFRDTDETGFQIEFISLGIVSEAGDELYCIDAAFKPESVDDAWLHDHVIRKLPSKEQWRSMDEIRAALMNFFEPAFEQEFWAKNGCYDHYILCRVFGGMGRFRDIMKAEKGTERITFRDTNEVRRQRPNISLPMQPEREKHIAINDARYEREIYNILTNSDE